MKVALVYDRVNKWGGAERVLLALHEIFPDAPLYTSVYSAKDASWAKVFPKVIPSFLQNIPFARRHHELFAWLMPLVFESFDLGEYDVIISVTSEAAKGVISKPHQKHICYCLTPTRYLWSGYNEYFTNSLTKKILTPVTKYLQYWDFIASNRADKIVSISAEVQKRVKNYYSKESEIIYPPLELKVQKSKVKTKKIKSNYFLIVSRLVPYKKVDIAIRAFNKLKLPLVIVGTGSEESKLRQIANSNITFKGHVSDTKLSYFYSQAQALILPQFEDFGLVAVEAIAHGTPVIAYKVGGALDIIVENINGIFFDHQKSEDLVKAVKTFHKISFSAKIISRSAIKFNKKHFNTAFKKLL